MKYFWVLFVWPNVKLEFYTLKYSFSAAGGENHISRIMKRFQRGPTRTIPANSCEEKNDFGIRM